MEKLLKKEVDLSRRIKVGCALVLALVLLLAAVFCGYLYTATRRIVRDQAVRSIANVSQLNEDSITRAFQSRQLLLQAIASDLEWRGVNEVDEILEELRSFALTYNFFSVGILDRDNRAHLLDGRVMDMSDSSFVGLVWDGEPHISSSYQPYVGGEDAVNAFSQPISYQGEVKYILMGICPSRLLTEQMNISSMEGRGYTFLVDGQGAVAVYPRQYQNETYNALMEHIDATPDIHPGEGGDQYFEFQGESYYAHFEELGINEWYLLTCARQADVFADADAIMSIAFLAIGVLLGIVLFSAGAFSFALFRAKHKQDQVTYYDSLLGIGNMNALEACYRQIPEQSLANMYLVVLDIDGFKDFNYIYGTENGDRLLKYLVRVMQEAAPEAYIFRYMSDFFVVLISSDTLEALADTMQQLDDRVDQDVSQGVIQPFEVSAGVRKLWAGESLRLALGDALIARETIKGNYLRHFAFYDETLRINRLGYMEISSAFPSALRDGEFLVFYQPKFDMTTGKIIGAEALARWLKPDGRLISPGEFIPCLEASFQIIMLDKAILTAVCQEMRKLKEEGIDFPPVSVNLSRVHLRHPDILPQLAAIIQESGIDPAKLSFEITESALLEENIPMKEIMDKIHALGCRVEMDDYGVGASSPNALVFNDFDMVKLDKSFVDGIGNERVEDVIRSTVRLAKKWGTEIMVEGVETQEQAERLLALGCALAQGYYYAMPMPEWEYRELLKAAVEGRRVGPEAPGCAAIADLSRHLFSEEYCAALDNCNVPIYIIDPESCEIMFCNLAMRAHQTEEPVGELCYRVFLNRKAPCADCAAIRLYREDGISPKVIHHVNGGWGLMHCSLLYWQGRKLVQVTCVDITEHKRLEAELKLRTEEYAALVRQSTAGIVRYDLGTGTAIVNVDANLNRVEEYAVENYFDVICEKGLVEEESLPKLRAMLQDIHNGVPSGGYDMDFVSARGKRLWCHLGYVLIRDEEGRPSRALICFFDNTEQRDALTGLYNRATAERLIREALDQGQGETFCFLIVDLDDLRGINGSFGHIEGDRALKSLADALKESYGEEAVLGRVGGDEFVAFLKTAPENDALSVQTAGFMDRLRASRIGPMNDRAVRASVGGAVGVAGRDDFKVLYARADLALFYTKAGGKNSFHFYTPELEDRNFLYRPRTTLTTGEADSDAADKLRKLLRAMAAFFPVVIHVNLTRNTYYMMEYMVYTTQRASDEGSFDEFMENGLHTFHPEDRETFMSCFRRESQLKAYAEGKRMLSYRGRQLGDDGSYHMMQMVTVFIEEENSEDVCEITFAHVMSE